MSVDPVSIGIKVALMAAQMALTASNKTEGPRLDSMDVSLADYGTPIRRFWGIRRLEGCPIIWAEKLREKRVESKGKGGKVENYKYSGTWAVLLADHEIDGITRIWLDKHLVYQSTGAGPIAPVVGLTEGPLGIPTKLGVGQNLRVYLGTEDQEPDPRMEAWCEDRYGADSCPAYRGTAYVVFQDIPLEKFGNRIPQVTIEAVNSKADVYPWESVPTDQTLFRLSQAPDQTKFVVYDWTDGLTFETWDAPTRTKLLSGTFPEQISGRVAIDRSGTLWALDEDSNNLLALSSDGIGATASTPIVFGSFPDSVRIVAGRAEDVVCLTATFAPGVHNLMYLSGDEFVYTDVGFSPTNFFQDTDGNLWCAGSAAASTTIGFYCFMGDRAGETHLMASPAGSTSQLDACHNGEGSFFCVQGSSYYLVDDATWAATTPVTHALFPTTGVLPFNAVRPGDPSVWIGATEVSLTDCSIIRSIDGSLWSGATASIRRSFFDPVNHALVCEPLAGGEFVWRYLDRVGSDGVTLSQIVNDVSGWCGVIGADSSALTQIIKGYSVSQGSGKDMIDPLLDMHDSDARPHDFGIQFIKRGQASGGSIPTADFVREGDEPRYKVTMAQDTDLPRRLTVNFADQGKDQQSNTVISQRPLDAVDGVREQTIDLTTYVASPSVAQQLADRRFRRQWNERETITNGVTMKHLAIEPGDVRQLSLDGLTRYARLEKMTLTQGRVDCEWRRDALSLNGLGSGEGAVMEGRDEEVIYVPSPTKGIVLDIPLLSDTHSNAAPLLYFAAGKYGTGSWPGAVVYKSDFDGDDYDPWNGVDSASSAGWGYCLGALPDASANLWDRGSSLNVRTFGGAYNSCTEAEIDADPSLNMAMVGDEAINFTTATLEADGTYTFSGFKRGRRGTEWAAATHATGDVFVLASSFDRDGLGLSEVGMEMSFKAQTVGRDPAFASVTEIDFDGRSLQPYAPARVKATFDGTDWTFTVIRRTRVGGAWVGGSTIPLSENSEAYEVEIYSGGTLKRTLSLSGTNAVTWTNAQQATDFGSTQSTKPSLIAYQLSDAVGRGFALAA